MNIYLYMPPDAIGITGCEGCKDDCNRCEYYNLYLKKEDKEQ